MQALKKMVVSLAALSFVSGVALAAPIVVYNKKVSEFQTISASFAADADSGNAWVNVERFDTEFAPTRVNVQKKVNGLSFDAASGTVVYKANGEPPIVCAKRKSDLTEKIYEPTGDCQLTVSYENRTIDKGKQPRSEKYAKVTLNPTTGSAQR